MDILQKLYSEKLDPYAKITEQSDDMKKHMLAISNRCQSLQMLFSNANLPELSQFCEKLNAAQMELLWQLENYIERHFPGIYKKG